MLFRSQKEDAARRAEAEKTQGFRMAELTKLEQEETEGQPVFSDEEKYLAANKEVDSRLAGVVAASTYYSNLINADTLIDPTDERSFLDKEIGAGKLTHNSLQALGLEELQDPDKPAKKSKPRSFDKDTADARKLQKQVVEALEQIEANDQLAKKFNLNVAPDPRTPYLRSILLKLEDLFGVEKLTEEQRAKYARPTELARKYRGEDLPVLTAYKSQTGAPVAEKYTPAQLARIRKDIVEIEKRLAADKAKDRKSTRLNSSHT